jgi:hypothetical protein
MLSAFGAENHANGPFRFQAPKVHDIEARGNAPGKRKRQTITH